MRMPWSKSNELQLDLLEAAAAPEDVSTPSFTTSTVAGQPLMLELASLYEDANNPRTEVPEVELDELAESIRQHGILQAIVVHPADARGRYRIHFGAKRWRAAQRIGLQEVPVLIRDLPADPYAQVAENQKRHGLTPLNLARFIRAQVDAGESKATIAKRLAIDPTTVAHHLALLALPPVLDAALKTGRCASPRTLYELSRLHTDQPERIAELVAGSEPITRDAVAEFRDAGPVASAPIRASTPNLSRPDRAAQMLARATGLCHRLDAALQRLTTAGTDSVPPDDVNALRQRVVALANRLGA